ncbi:MULTISPECIES: NAD(+) diphosphatase [Gulosibacter]|uniref:NAD(+) diphosphatase n=1 Tax=Gulosibacter TaxID=256818 RepID=UPI001F16B27B|nr:MULTISPECIES: NAD(+) diphosphatase [Gulosibacter]
MNEFVDRLALSRAAHDRDDAHRSDATLLEHPDVRILVQRRDATLVGETEQGRALRLDLRPVDQLGGVEQLREGPAMIYLGKLTQPRENPGGRVDEVGTPIFAAAISDFEAGELEPDSERWADLRERGAGFDDLDTGLAAQALAMRNFHSAHAFSPSTGARAVSEHNGWVLRGEEGGDPTFPRTDAAIIVGVIDQNDRILLGANVNWTPKRYSVLAGFVEPGESLEHAVIREAAEESGARVRNPRYLGSQPWPFPASLMLGFLAELDPSQDPAEVVGDGVEIAEVRWFTREEIVEHVDQLPGRISIARAIIEEWYGGPIG